MSEKKPSECEAIAQWMATEDRFARMLGMEIEAVAPGYCRVGMNVTGEMLNAVGITHGGVTFSLADFAFAVASNSHGRVAVALSAQINYPRASRLGDRLTATATETSRNRRTALYTIEVRQENNELVGHFTGNVFLRDDTVTEWMTTNN